VIITEGEYALVRTIIKMSRKNENFVSSILILAIIIIFCVTVYFCLDIFEVIDVPEQYSLVNLLTTKVEIVTAAESLEDVIPDKIKEEIDTSTEKIQKENVLNENSELITNVTPPDFSAYQTQDETVTIEENTSNVELENSSNAQTKFYYSQLDVYAKLMYDELYKNIDNLKTGTYTVDFDVTFNKLLHEDNGADTLEADFQLAVNALTFDKPEVFFLDITKMYLFTEITTLGSKQTYRVSIGANDNVPYLASSFSNYNDVIMAEAQIESVVNSYISNSSTTYNKIKLVHDNIVENTEYDATISKDNIYNIYGALVGKEAVCEGYAKSFKYIMDRLDIPCIIVCGTGQNSKGQIESHAWNYVFLDSNWYAVDATWDDPIIIGFGNATNEMRYHYFLKGSTDFSKDHFEDGTLIGTYRFSYPTLSVSNY
jgi:hypothetical protein